MSADNGALPGEIWQDAEGCLMTKSSGDNWWVFAVKDPISQEIPRVAHPLERVFNQAGEFVGTNLKYPDRSVLARRSAPPLVMTTTDDAGAKTVTVILGRDGS